jgi:serine/threonine protein kinase
MTPRTTSHLDAAARRALIERYNAFEAEYRVALLAGSPRPTIADYLTRTPEALRWLTARELIALEWELRRGHGEEPTLAEYLAAYPEYADALPVLAQPSTVPQAPGPREEDDLPPDAIPGYRLERLLGRGGMGEVYLAVELYATPDDALRTVALKCIRRDVLGTAAARRAMVAELKLAASLRHDHIVPLLRVGPPDGPLYYTMEYMPGGSLADRLRRGPLPGRTAAELLRKIARAIAHLHARQFVHLDLKPANILLDAAGEPYVADFGLARLLADGQVLALTHTVGTRQYMPPEQYQRRVGFPTDVYGLGAILYEMLTGRPPFQGTTAHEVMWQVVNQELVPPRAQNRRLDRDLETICLRCLAKEPGHRYPSVNDLLADLDRYLAREPIRRESVWEWLARQMVMRSRLEDPALWSRLLTGTAAMSILGHGLLFGLSLWQPPAWAYWVWFLVFHGQIFVLPVAYLARRNRLESSERGLVANWVVVILADLLLFRLFCPLFGTPPPEQVFAVYSAWTVAHAMLWFVEAREYWGRFYIVSLAFFAMSAVMPFVLPVAPLVFAAVNVSCLLWLASGLRDIAQAAKDEPVSVQS